MKRLLHGVLPVLHMAYRDDFEIDYDVLGREVDYAFECGADGVVLALASELLRLTDPERFAVAQFLVGAASGRGTVTISVGAESTFAAVAFARHAEAIGATALMAIPPLSVALGEDQLAAYYDALMAATSLPLVVQDASSYVGRPMSSEFQIEMWLRHGARIGFKPEAAPVGPVISALQQVALGQAAIYEGSGGTGLVENHRRGIAGTMPGTDLLDALVALWRALERGDEDTTYAISPLLGSMLALAVGLDGYVVTAKHNLKRRGVFDNTLVRGPVAYALDSPAERELDRLFDRLQGALADAPTLCPAAGEPCAPGAAAQLNGGGAAQARARN